MDTKHHEVIRIGTQNARGLTQYVSSHKNIQLRETIDDFNLDVLLLSEINVYWKNVSPFDSWAERMKKSKEQECLYIATTQWRTPNTLNNLEGQRLLLLAI